MGAAFQGISPPVSATQALVGIKLPQSSSPIRHKYSTSSQSTNIYWAPTMCQSLFWVL